MAALCALSVSAACGSGSSSVAPPVESWSLVSDTLATPGLASQGLAGLPGLGADEFAYSSELTIGRGPGNKVDTVAFPFPKALASQHFDHLGDIDAWNGAIYGGLEDNSEPHGAIYHRALIAYDATTLAPLGFAVDPGSPDAPGDGDAPWVAVSPDGAWVATAEWDPQRAVLLFHRDEVVADASGNAQIEAAARVPLDSTLARVQGCDFDGPTTLVCSSDDATTGRLVYAIVFSDAVDGHVDLTHLTAHVEPLFPTGKPANLCGADEEVEGIDVSGDELRVMVIGTCKLDTHLYLYTRAP